MAFERLAKYIFSFVYVPKMQNKCQLKRKKKNGRHMRKQKKPTCGTPARMAKHVIPASKRAAFPYFTSGDPQADCHG